jgi:hypothetical protein
LKLRYVASILRSVLLDSFSNPYELKEVLFLQTALKLRISYDQNKSLNIKQSAYHC